jgi:hypothetical protein
MLKVSDLEETGPEEMPEDFGQLQNLTRIEFADSKLLQDLGESLGCLGNARVLRLVQLPESFTTFPSLESLDLRDCKLYQPCPHIVHGIHFEITAWFLWMYFSLLLLRNLLQPVMYSRLQRKLREDPWTMRNTGNLEAAPAECGS